VQGGGPGLELLRIRLLGSLEVSFGGQGLRFGRKKALALLSYLAAGGGKRTRRELAELLWPKSGERRARADLRSILNSFGVTLEEGGTSGHGRGEEIEPYDASETMTRAPGTALRATAPSRPRGLGETSPPSPRLRYLPAKKSAWEWSLFSLT
jgi:hypothetical protein